MNRKLALVLAGVLLLSIIYWIAPGFRVREDVVLTDYLVPPGQSEMTIVVGVSGSAGYTRAVRNVSDDPRRMRLQFYAAYGGLNGSVGERHRFVLDLLPECEDISIYRHGTFEPVLRKEKGEWVGIR